MENVKSLTFNCIFMASNIGLDLNLFYGMRTEDFAELSPSLNTESRSIGSRYNDFRQELKAWRTAVWPYYKKALKKIAESYRNFLCEYPLTTTIYTMISTETAIKLSAIMITGHTHSPISYLSWAFLPTTYCVDKLLQRDRNII